MVVLTWPQSVSKQYPAVHIPTGRQSREVALVTSVGGISLGIDFDAEARSVPSQPFGPLAVRRKSMFAAKGAMHDPSSFVPTVLMIIIGATVFWRMTIKVLAIAFLLLAILGLSELLQNVH